MKVETLVRDQELVSWFRGHYFYLRRDGDNEELPGCWYVIVTTEAGHALYEGWIRDSESMAMREAFVEACRGSLIEPPKRWPREEGLA